MNKKAKDIIGCISFMVGLLILFAVLSVIFVPKDNSREAGMEAVQANGILGEKENTIDYIILGDSETHSSFTPMQIWKDYGYTGYVCGTNAQHLYESEKFLRQALKHQSPKYVILETNAIYRYSSIENAIMAKAENYFPLFRYHDRWKNLKFSDLGGSVQYTYTNYSKGYRFEDRIDGVENKEYMKPTERTKHITKINRHYVNNIINLCKENHIELILVSTPSISNWTYAKHNGIQKLADQNGLTYIDMNLMQDQLEIDWETDTRDKGDHLNYSGAVKVTDWLGTYFKQCGEFTDHRQDAAYQSWNKDLKRYEKKVSGK